MDVLNEAVCGSRKVVGAHFGLTPRVYQSGEIDRSGQISKAGDSMLRLQLYEAASALMTRCRQPSKLRAWGAAIGRRRGDKRARVAVARNLCRRRRYTAEDGCSRIHQSAWAVPARA